MKPATHAHLATRLDLLEQKFDHLPTGEGGGGGADPAIVERIFDKVFGWSYSAPNEEGAIQSPPSSNATLYDRYPGYNNYSMQRTLLGASAAGGFSEAAEWHTENVSAWDAVWGSMVHLIAIHGDYGSLAAYAMALEFEVNALKARMSSVEGRLAAAGL